MAQVRILCVPLFSEGCATGGVMDAVTPSQRVLFDVVKYD